MEIWNEIIQGHFFSKWHLEPTFFFFFFFGFCTVQASSSSKFKKRVKQKQQQKKNKSSSHFLPPNRDNNNCNISDQIWSVGRNDGHRLLPPKPLLLRNELLYRAPELLVLSAQLPSLRRTPAGFHRSPANLRLRPTERLPPLLRRESLRHAPPILFPRIGPRFRILQNNVLRLVNDLLLGADLRVAFAVLQELVVEIDAGGSAGGRSAGELAGFEE